MVPLQRSSFGYKIEDIARQQVNPAVNNATGRPTSLAEPCDPTSVVVDQAVTRRIGLAPQRHADKTIRFIGAKWNKIEPIEIKHRVAV